MSLALELPLTFGAIMGVFCAGADVIQDTTNTAWYSQEVPSNTNGSYLVLVGVLVI